MAFPAELKSYNNEEHFTDDFLIPLLQRLGFSIVVNFHGASEFGKDIIFGEIDRFGHVVYHGLQAKYVPSISLSASDELIEDAKQAFNNPFTHPQTGQTERISTFFACNGGTISDQATTHFFNSLQPIHGANVRILDGKALVALDRLAALNSGAFVKERLSGLLLEIRYNRMTTVLSAKRMSEFLDGGSPPMARFRLVATEAVLAQPILLIEDFVNALHRYWGRCNVFNNLLDGASAPLANVEFRRNQIRTATELLGTIEQDACKISEYATSHLSSIGMTVSLTPDS